MFTGDDGLDFSNFEMVLAVLAFSLLILWILKDLVTLYNMCLQTIGVASRHLTIQRQEKQTF